MANVKQEGKIVEDVVGKTTKTVTKKTTATKAAKEEAARNITGNVELKKLEVENKELKSTIDDLTTKFNQLMGQLVSQANSPRQEITVTQPRQEKFKIVNLTSDSNVIELQTIRGLIRLVGYEDWIEVEEEQFRDVARKYHNLFKIGALTTDSKGAEIIEQRKIKIASKWLSQHDKDNLDELNVDELSKLYKGLHPQQREVLVDTFIEGINKGEKKGFRDLSKITELNRIYDGLSDKQRIKNAILKLSE